MGGRVYFRGPSAKESAAVPDAMGRPPARGRCYSCSCFLTAAAAKLLATPALAADLEGATATPLAAVAAPALAARQLSRWAAYPPGLHDIELRPDSVSGSYADAFIDDHARNYLLFVPHSYRAEVPTALWICAPGSLRPPRLAFNYWSDVVERHNAAMVVLSGHRMNLNVGKDAQAMLKCMLNSDAPCPDDVMYTKAVLLAVSGLINIDIRRIYCVGFSRGARFCSRLASELSNFVAAMAIFGGIRYPRPNNASHPVPVLAVHGLLDTTNPFAGGGNPYWGDSVPDVVADWASFNGCRDHPDREVLDGGAMGVSRYSECIGNSTVELYAIKDGAHIMPPDFGDIAGRFFEEHPGTTSCHTALPGEPCHRSVMEAMQGRAKWPAQYEELTQASSFEAFQSLLRRRFFADCPEPCPPPNPQGSGAGVSSQLLLT